MNTLGHLEQLLTAGIISEEEYKERKQTYIETILELYVMGIIDKATLQEIINKWYHGERGFAPLFSIEKIFSKIFKKVLTNYNPCVII